MNEECENFQKFQTCKVISKKDRIFEDSEKPPKMVYAYLQRYDYSEIIIRLSKQDYLQNFRYIPGPVA